MIKEGIEAIKELAEEAKAVELFGASSMGEPGDVYFTCTGKGELARHVAEGLRAYKALRVKDLADMVEDRVKIGDFGLIYVFAGKGRAFALFGEGERRHGASFTAVACPQFAFVGSLPGRKLQPRDFVSMLRVDLAGCVPAEFLAWARQIKFTAKTEADNDVQVGRESMGRKIENQALGIGTVPETVVLRVPTHDDLVDADGVLMRFEVECAVDLDYQVGALRLVPLAGEMTAAMRKADEWICAQLKGLEDLSKESTTRVKVFCGF